MNSVVGHYERHLARIYAWSVGGIESALIRGAVELNALHLPDAHGARALDLGAGFGLHSLPLAERGYQVTAIDTCEPLLNELRARVGTLPIQIIQADLRNAARYVQSPLQVVLCMGDTLTHLPDTASVEALFDAVATLLDEHEVFALTFRDYVTRALQGDDRFILVHSDADRILTCLLEYSEHYVQVHDVLHERAGGGQWRMSVSAYPKLRLAPEWVAQRLIERGLSIRRESSGSMVRFIARRPAT